MFKIFSHLSQFISDIFKGILTEQESGTQGIIIVIVIIIVLGIVIVIVRKERNETIINFNNNDNGEV